MRTWLFLSAASAAMLVGCDDDKGPGGIPVGRDAGGDARADGEALPSRELCADVPADVTYCTVSEAEPLRGTCEAGEACLSGGCGFDEVTQKAKRYCAPAGAGCQSADDCCDEPPCTGVVCSAAGHCAATGAGCLDWRTCPDGFACEEGACKDRRVPCSGAQNCPAGFYCKYSPYAANLYCSPSFTLLCEGPQDCPGNSTALEPMRCADVYGDGKKRCIFAGGEICPPGGHFGPEPPDDPDTFICKSPARCDSRADCAGGASGAKTCGLAPAGDGFSECGPRGPCISAEDCAAGDACVDVHGYGWKTCLPPGACDADADCPDRRTRCFDVAGAGVAECSTVLGVTMD